MRAILALTVAAALTLHAASFDSGPMHVPEGSPIRRRLLIPGDGYHGGEVSARSGERWLALRRSPDGNTYRTEVVTLRIRPAFDPVLDTADNARPSGKSVAIAEAGASPLFLLRGFASLAGRTIPTSLDGQFPLAPNTPVTIHLGSRSVVLQVHANGKVEEAPGREKVVHHQVNIREGETWFPLPLVVSNYTSVSLLWAGDLDGDGKLDFLFADSGENWASHRLFLSSLAKPGRPVAEAAQFRITGC